ncbi:MAG: zinc ribbon domain-containing protein [bacterium]|nr:zinc ribbon domain-containing protein [bacterium]
MPTYEYRCRTCDARFEVRQSFAEDGLTVCPSADSQQSPAACVAPGAGAVQKLFSAPSISFKGDGFYKTDSRSGAARAANGSKDKKPAEQAAKSGEGAAAAAGGGKESSAAAGGESKGDRATAGAGSS